MNKLVALVRNQRDFCEFVMCITKTWLQDNTQVPIITINNCQRVRLDRNISQSGKKRGHGLDPFLITADVAHYCKGTFP